MKALTCLFVCFFVCHWKCGKKKHLFATLTFLSVKFTVVHVQLRKTDPRYYSLSCNIDIQLILKFYRDTQVYPKHTLVDYRELNRQVCKVLKVHPSPAGSQVEPRQL